MDKTAEIEAAKETASKVFYDIANRYGATVARHVFLQVPREEFQRIMLTEKKNKIEAQLQELDKLNNLTEKPEEVQDDSDRS